MSIQHFGHTYREYQDYQNNGDEEEYSVVYKTLCLSLCAVLLIAFAEAKGKKPKGQKPGKFRPANEAPMFDVQDPPSQEECVEQCIQNTQIYTAEGCEYTCKQMIASSS
ncbi:hypothetical protein CAPTEDRAFT_207324 [Capitella teleta]|uniref:Uncharacterized protein n=1 Tax=Capitella teleta TaxID=283909 RepID=R7V8B6_CAPTE|nr:hypothetical protein CAPTEDRAFT_207324 [Capitella teleta]|eukprot:ELU14732.1 hypothetical protein CAPTEDRAFT_207324 [Capitella teleta]